MKAIVKFNKVEKKLQCNNENNIPIFCSKCICDENKKCQKFYKKIYDEKRDGLQVCPYGFYTYYIRNTVYTCIILETDLKKVKNNIESKGQKINDFNKYKKEQIEDIILDFEEFENNNIILSDCIHDLGNIGSYFNAMTETIEYDYSDLVEKDENIKALILLYDLLNYRLDVIEGIKIQNDKRVLQKVHPQIRKLVILMKYQAKNKNVKFDYGHEQNNKVYLSRNIYLAMFLLMENAVKHSPFDSTIFIDFKENDDYTETIISNNSRKIEKDEIPKLVQRGYRGVNTISKGSGLGLTLAKKILDEYDADFKIEVIDINKSECIYKVSFKFYTYRKHRETKK